VIELIERIYRSGLLSRFSFFGERKGTFNAIATADWISNEERSELAQSLNELSADLSFEDVWPANVLTLKQDYQLSIIDSEYEKILLYLNSLKMLWRLGISCPSSKETPFDTQFLKKIDELEIMVRAKNVLHQANIKYIGDLVQLSHAQLVRMPHMGFKGAAQIEEALNMSGLNLSTEIPGWPLSNVEALSNESAESLPAA
jgi:Bacterial RNA polymerase, alpha chain C terminal domain